MYNLKLKMKEITLQEMLSTIIGELRKKWKMGNSPYLPIHIECVFRIQQLSEFASAQTNSVVLKRF